MEDKLARIRPYYKHELCKLYGITIKTLIKRIEIIEDYLKEYGYNKAQKIFSLKHIEIIFKNIGHPPANETSGVYVNEKVPTYIYTKPQLAKLYNFSGKTLLAQIEALPYEEIKMEIMDGGNIHVYQRRIDKQNFTRKEVALIFEYLGHPYED